MTQTNYTWRIANLERETADGYVFRAAYTIDASDGVYAAGAAGTIEFERPEADLIPYASLTEDQVVSWVQAKLGAETIANIEAALLAQLNEQHQPTKAAGLPWVK
jgi:hypothetical protein